MKELNSKDLVKIIKEELLKFKETKKKDQFAEKFSQVFVEALEPHKENFDLIKEDVYNFLKKYTTAEKDSIKEKQVLVNEKNLLNLEFGLKLFHQEIEKLKLFENIEIPWILEGLTIAEDELSSILNKKSITESVGDKGFIERDDKEKQEEEWEIKALYRIYTAVKHAAEELQNTQQIKKEQVDGLKSAVVSFEEFFRKHSVYEGLGFDKTSQPLETAPPPKLAILYAKTFAQKMGYKWTNFNVASAPALDAPSTPVSFTDPEFGDKILEVWWVTPSDYGYFSPHAASVPNAPNGAKLYGEW